MYKLDTFEDCSLAFGTGKLKTTFFLLYLADFGIFLIKQKSLQINHRQKIIIFSWNK